MACQGRTAGEPWEAQSLSWLWSPSPLPAVLPEVHVWPLLATSTARTSDPSAVTRSLVAACHIQPRLWLDCHLCVRGRKEPHTSSGQIGQWIKAVPCIYPSWWPSSPCRSPMPRWRDGQCRKWFFPLAMGMISCSLTSRVISESDLLYQFSLFRDP